MPHGTHADLPNPFRRESGSLVNDPAQWADRRLEISRSTVDVAYGNMPPPIATRIELLHSAVARQYSGARILSCSVHVAVQTGFSFMLQLLVPPTEGRLPVVLTGDACWAYATDRVTAEVLRRGYVMAQFNRVELAPDNGPAHRQSGIYPFFPSLQFGALAAWAWGYQRCIDALIDMPFVDPTKIAVVAHSRGGKAALLAGAVDERIALTSANNSGAGGAGCYRIQGPKSETLMDLMREFPHWFGPRLLAYVGREAALPFDQHFLKALVAPRALLTTEALDDHWANPQGTWQTHVAAREVFRYLGAPNHIAVKFRAGGHDHTYADWCVFLDFSDALFQHRLVATTDDGAPFSNVPPAFSWRHPPVRQGQ